jgi:8-oxo-dGTP pyrophosphatase MutT (NUDIX family)
MSIHNKNPWKAISSKTVHKNPWFSVREDDVIRPDGSKGVYNVVVSPGAAFIVAIDNDKLIYFIGQYRYPTNMYSIEIPAGSIDKQSPLIAAKRELKEETGLVAKHWKKLGTFQTANGMMSELSYVYMANGLTQTNDNEQSEEGIQELRKIPIEEALDLIKTGDITDGQSIAALMMAALELGLLVK